VTEPEIIRGRFAPSPTGPLHLGSLVAALASYLAAKSRHGQWLIRIEDLDPPREIPGMAQRQLHDLAGFALHSELPVLWQSQRSEAYENALRQLLEQDKAFYCSCSRTQLQDQQGIHRRCVSQGHVRQGAIRLRVPDETMEFTDGIYGLQRQNLAAETGDVVLKRADGLYAYQLAVVVDDAAQGVNQVVRGADLLDSTPRQIYLQRQLGLPSPEYLHIPLVLDQQGHKLSKSQWAAGLDPDDRFNAFCAAYRHLGQDDKVLGRQSDMARNLSAALQHFDLDRLKRTTVRG
jgi:glutamyl-Q tRNA(Asp) synthetase